MSWVGLIWFGLSWVDLVWFVLVWFNLVWVWFGLFWFFLVELDWVELSGFGFGFGLVGLEKLSLPPCPTAALFFIEGFPLLSGKGALGRRSFHFCNNSQ